MKSLRNRLQARFDEEKGAVLIFVAGSLLILLGFVAFATDLGWFYLNTSHAQRTADAASLAGVIRMPSDFAQAELDAKEIAAANGFVDGVDGTTVVVEEVYDTAGLQLPYQLKVTVTREVPTFFLNAFGKQTELISRTATAEFIPPIPLGSRDNFIGNQGECNPSGGPGCPAFWANIHGRYTDTRMGDAYSSRCFDGAGSGAGCVSGNPDNPTWRAEGTRMASKSCLGWIRSPSSSSTSNSIKMDPTAIGPATTTTSPAVIPAQRRGSPYGSRMQHPTILSTIRSCPTSDASATTRRSPDSTRAIPTTSPSIAPWTRRAHRVSMSFRSSCSTTRARLAMTVVSTGTRCE